MPGPKYASNFNNNAMLNSYTYENDVSESSVEQNRVKFVPYTSRGFVGYGQSGLNFQNTVVDAVASLHNMTQQLLSLQRVLPNLGGIVRLLEPVGVSTTILPPGYLSSTPTQINLNTGFSTIDGQTMVAGGGSTSRALLNLTGTMSTLNGIYLYGLGTTGIGTFTRAYDMSTVSQVIYGSAVISLNGTVNKGQAFYVSGVGGVPGSDYYAWNTMSFGLTTSAVNFTQYFPQSSPNYGGFTGAGTTTLITGTENSFLAQAYSTKFEYIRNRALRLAWNLTKLAQNVGVGASVISPTTDIGYSTNNDLPANSRYPSSWNRGWK